MAACCSYGRLEVHARLLLPVPQLASEAASAPALACQPLSISMAHLLSPPACPPASAQDMLALWASLPVQVRRGLSWLVVCALQQGGTFVCCHAVCIEQA